jgi:hypothetical protein
MSSINVPVGAPVPCAGTVARVIDGPPPAPFVPDAPAPLAAVPMLRADGLPTLEGYIAAGYPAANYERFLEVELAARAVTPEQAKALEAERYGLNTQSEEGKAAEAFVEQLGKVSEAFVEQLGTRLSPPSDEGEGSRELTADELAATSPV